MEVVKGDYADWRSHDITVAFLADLSAAYELTAQEILERWQVDVARDQYLKGVMAGMSLAAGWKPVFIKEDDTEETEEQDAD